MIDDLEAVGQQGDQYCATNFLFQFINTNEMLVIMVSWTVSRQACMECDQLPIFHFETKMRVLYHSRCHDSWRMDSGNDASLQLP